MFSGADIDGDGQINYDEYLQLPKDAEKVLEFKGYDLDGSGLVSAAELRIVLKD